MCLSIETSGVGFFLGSCQHRAPGRKSFFYIPSYERVEESQALPFVIVPQCDLRVCVHRDLRIPCMLAWGSPPRPVPPRSKIYTRNDKKYSRRRNCSSSDPNTGETRGSSSFTLRHRRRIPRVVSSRRSRVGSQVPCTACPCRRARDPPAASTTSRCPPRSSGPPLLPAPPLP